MSKAGPTAPIEFEPGRWTPTFDAGACANCARPTRFDAPLFCSELCAQTATLVRYARRKVADNTIDQPDIAEAIQMRLASVLGGGYPEKARRLTRAVRLAIFERDSHTCQLCGGDATEIDHIAGSSSDPSNLRALCRSCNLGLAQAHFGTGWPRQATSRRADLAAHRSWPARATLRRRGLLGKSLAATQGRGLQVHRAPAWLTAASRPDAKAQLRSAVAGAVYRFRSSAVP